VVEKAGLLLGVLAAGVLPPQPIKGRARPRTLNMERTSLGALVEIAWIWRMPGRLGQLLVVGKCLR